MGRYSGNASKLIFTAESLAEELPTFCSGFHPLRSQDVHVLLDAHSSLGHMIGLWQGVGFMSVVSLDILSCAVHPFPSFDA